MTPNIDVDRAKKMLAAAGYTTNPAGGERNSTPINNVGKEPPVKVPSSNATQPVAATAGQSPSAGPQQVLTNAATGAVVPSIPSDYAALGAAYGFQPPEPSRLTMLLTGFSGVGKTTFVSSIPRALVVSFQPDGAGSVIAARAAHIHIKDWASWDRLRAKLVKDAANPTRPFDTIVIDTGDEWFGPLSDRIIALWNERAKTPANSIGDVGQKGKGFAEVGVLMTNELRAIQSAGYGWVVTGHLAEKTVDINGVSTTKIRPVLTPSCFQHLVRGAFIKAQIIPFTQTTRRVERQLEDGRRIESTISIPESERVREYRLTIRAGDSDTDIKARLPGLPQYISLPSVGGWDEFSAKYAAAVERGRAQHDAILSGASPE